MHKKKMKQDNDLPFAIHHCYKNQVIGKKLMKLFYTKRDGPHEIVPGGNYAYFFSTVMELDDNKRLAFSNDGMVEWKHGEELFEVDESWCASGAIFKGQVICDLTKDEFDQLTFHLENGVTITHSIDWGDQLFIMSESERNKGV